LCDTIKLNLVLSNDIESKTKAKREKDEDNDKPEHIKHDLANHIDERSYFFEQTQEVRQFGPNDKQTDHFSDSGSFMKRISISTAALTGDVH
jgi:hypothetical protein